MGGHFSRKGRSESSQPVGSASHPPKCIWKGKYDSVIKFIVVGDCSTGKTTLLKGFSETYWQHDYDPSHSIHDFFTLRLVELDGSRIKLQIWEGYGHPNLRQHNRPHFLGGTRGVVIVYDVTREETFGSVADWIKELNHNGTHFVLVGNKCDCTDEKVVDYRRARDFANERRIPFFEVSAKDGTNVELVFITLVAALHKFA